MKNQKENQGSIIMLPIGTNVVKNEDGTFNIMFKKR